MQETVACIMAMFCISLSSVMVHETFRKPKQEVSHGYSKADVPASLPGNSVQKPRSPECPRSDQKGSGSDHKAEKRF